MSEEEGFDPPSRPTLFDHRRPKPNGLMGEDPDPPEHDKIIAIRPFRAELLTCKLVKVFS